MTSSGDGSSAQAVAGATGSALTPAPIAAYGGVMGASVEQPVSIDLTPAEAKLVIAALRQFEPYWPSDMDAMDRADLLDGIRRAIEHVRSSLED